MKYLSTKKVLFWVFFVVHIYSLNNFFHVTNPKYFPHAAQRKD